MSCIFSLINIIFFYELPLEFFYMEDISSFFGGSAVYYLGLYGFGSKVSRPKERSEAAYTFMKQVSCLIKTQNVIKFEIMLLPINNFCHDKD